MPKEATQWKKGQSGNPAGRPKGTKNYITQLKQNLEAAVRENANPSKVAGIIDTMCDLALDGNVGAAKLILDKFVSNAKTEEDSEHGTPKLVFEVKNLTINPREGEVIDITPEEQD